MTQSDNRHSTGTVTDTSDKADGPTAGRHTVEVTDFIGRRVAHIPDKGVEPANFSRAGPWATGPQGHRPALGSGGGRGCRGVIVRVRARV